MLIFLGEFLLCSVAVPILLIFNLRLDLLGRLSSDLGKGDVLQCHRGRLRVGHQGVLLPDDDSVDRPVLVVSGAAVWSVKLVGGGDVVGVEADLASMRKC